MDDLPLRPLAVFVRVVERQGLSAAARSLGVSPSAVSQAVRALEARVGVPLLVRTTSSLRPTEAGAELARRAARALADLDDALAQATESGARIAGRLRVTAPHVTLDPIVRPTLAALHREHPGLDVEVSVDDRLVDLVTERYDLGLRLSEVVPREYVAARLTPAFRAVIVGSPAYLAARGRPRHPRDLAAHACIGFRYPSSGALYHWELERGAEETTIGALGPFVSDDTSLIVDAAVDGRGLAYVLEPSVSRELTSGALEVVLPQWAPPVSGFFACYPREGRRSPKVRAFVAIARRVSRPVTAAPGSRATRAT